MAIETEHKYLVLNAEYRSLAQPVVYKQGYLSVTEKATVRVRLAGNSGWFTIKSRISDLSRYEYEYSIPAEDASHMLLTMCTGYLVEKLRYTFKIDGQIWEVDEFLSENAGLVVAETEVKSENEIVQLPAWIGEEITHDARYLNSSLSKIPFTFWKK